MNDPVKPLTWPTKTGDAAFFQHVLLKTEPSFVQTDSRCLKFVDWRRASQIYVPIYCIAMET